MFKKQLPTALKQGDKVALIAPSSPPENHSLVESGAYFIKNLGLVPVIGESCYSQYGYLSGNDDIRAYDINWAFADPSISGIFCIRGGYGLQRILDKIDFESIKNNPKFFCGYSDITALHNAIPDRTGLISFHTPMLSTPKFAEADPYTLEHFTRQIFGNSKGKIINPKGHEWKFLQNGKAKGELCGGNLSIIVSSLKTPYEINCTGKILFIEEVEEAPYKIDRMLNQLRLAGKLDECVGIIFGDFADCMSPEPEKSLTINEIIQNLKLKVPILWNFRCGHCYPTASLPMGMTARLDATSDTFEIL